MKTICVEKSVVPDRHVEFLFCVWWGGGILFCCHAIDGSFVELFRGKYNRKDQ